MMSYSVESMPVRTTSLLLLLVWVVLDQVVGNELDWVRGSVSGDTYLTLASSVMAWRSMGTTVLSRYCLADMFLIS